MKKIMIILLTLIVSILVINLPKVYAEEIGLSGYQNSETNEVIKNYLYYLKKGDKKAYNYIDTNNKELKKKTKKYLGRVNVTYVINDIREENNTINVSITMNAISNKYDEDDSWHVYGMTSKFVLNKDDNGNLKIIDTDMFNYFYLDDITRIFKIIGLVFSLIIVGIIVLVIKKSNKKKKLLEEYNATHYNQQIPQNPPINNQ